MELLFRREAEPEQKLKMMREDSSFEFGSDAEAEAAAISSADKIRASKAPPKVSKIYLCGRCAFNCSYCACRAGLDRESYLLSPAETARLAVDAATESGHGIFVSSAIYRNADTTQEMLAESVRIMRRELGFQGFIHAKVMPGADPLLIERTGRYANRLSVNLEVAQSSGYAKIAKQKNRNNILTPMGEISGQILQNRYEKQPFAKSQVTQIMAGSTGEDDRTIMNLSSALYKKYRLKRIYYTAFTYRTPAKGYEGLPTVQTPLWRMLRLYQADRLTQLYGFSPDEVTPASDPFLSEDLDPKTAYALRNLDLYPVEVNRADFDTLLRIPGIGVISAQKIISARRYCAVTHDILKKMRVSLKKSVYFITCNGKYQGGNLLLSPYLRDVLSGRSLQLSLLGENG